MKSYGKFLSVAEANEMVSKGMEIKEKYNAGIGKLTKNDAEATRFFCGGDALYVFSKKGLGSLMGRLSDEENDCVVIFPACRKDEPGRPTLIVFVYKLDQNDKLLHLVRDENKGGEDGTEHPGGNGGFKLKKKPGSSNLYEIPETIKPGDINFAFE